MSEAIRLPPRAQARGLRRVRGASRVTAGLPAALGATALGAPASVAAHGFGQRFDLPLPLWLWVAGAAATIALTFVAVAVFVRDPRFGTDPPRLDLLRYRIVRWAAHPAVVALVRTLAVALFVLAVCAGLFGVQDPYRNLIVPLVWVVWWVGFAFFCALAGDLWALVNPLRTMFAWGEALLARTPRGRVPHGRLRYPACAGAWPGVALFLAFVWAELVWRDKDVPAALAWTMLAYAAVTWLGMLAFGREVWLGKGEAFAIAFGVLARFAPLEYRAASLRSPEPRLDLRPFGAGLLTGRPESVSSMVFVLSMLASVTFDGFQQTPLMQRIETSALDSRFAAALFRLSELGLDETQLIHTAALAAFPLAFVAIFLCACRMMPAAARWWGGGGAAARAPRTMELACTFVLTLVPIAVAYHLSHYFTLLLTAGQFAIPLASDPFGYGWDLFGTARYEVDLGLVSPYVFWYGAVALIVAGHVIAVVLAHIEALRVFGGRRRALASQIPVVVLMIAYTTLSLWILAQPIVG
jgi:hypothetical protein